MTAFFVLYNFRYTPPIRFGDCLSRFLLTLSFCEIHILCGFCLILIVAVLLICIQGSIHWGVKLFSRRDVLPKTNVLIADFKLAILD
ncbi:hypothetical protein DXA95_17610 [Odoribacter sp. OF09-27XD]|nr:hypothetical protein DXA95_17610 [Odoribacter sp. OF09-27XD]